LMTYNFSTVGCRCVIAEVPDQLTVDVVPKYGRFLMAKELSQAHPLDTLVAWLSRYSKLFSQGWGDESLLAHLSRDVSQVDPSVPIHVRWTSERGRNGSIVSDGIFESPFRGLPPQVGTVHVRAWKRPAHQAACVILAASRDEGYAVRERVFGSLVERDIDLYFVESPFYGRRRTAAGPAAITVSDQGLMALSLVWEASALLRHLGRTYERIAISGYSMGGHMAAITAAVSPFPVACAALATGASASSIYTRGLLSWSVDVNALGGAHIHKAIVKERLHHAFEAADVTCYPLPQRPDAAVIAGCTRDGYVLRTETERLHRHWRGSTLRWIPAGHFSALVTQRRSLCNCIESAMARL
jgi:hypothetical protein